MGKRKLTFAIFPTYVVTNITQLKHLARACSAFYGRPLGTQMSLVSSHCANETMFLRFCNSMHSLYVLRFLSAIGPTFKDLPVFRFRLQRNIRRSSNR